MFKRLWRGWKHSLTIVLALFHPSHRNLLRQMVKFSRALPSRFDQPLPKMMAGLTPVTPLDLPVPPDNIRRLADAVAAWHLRAPLGICLRRSLIRYHFLRQANVPVAIVFGARLKNKHQGGGIGGHAWLTLNGEPYYENPDDYIGFAEMYVYPNDANRQG